MLSHRPVDPGPEIADVTTPPGTAFRVLRGLSCVSCFEGHKRARRCTHSLLLILAACLAFARPATAIVYLTKEKALNQVLPKSEKIDEEERVLTSKQKEAIEKRLRGRIKEKSFTFFVGRTGDKVDGYAAIQDEMGKELPITFVVGIAPDGKVSQVAVMEFRESRGSEVRHKRFLQQFEKKDAGDAMSLGRDIKNITGATLSCRAAALAVRKVLAAWEVLYGEK